MSLEEMPRPGSRQAIEEWAENSRLAEAEAVLQRVFGPGSFPEPPLKAMNARMKNSNSSFSSENIQAKITDWLNDGHPDFDDSTIMNRLRGGITRPETDEVHHFYVNGVCYNDSQIVYPRNEPRRGDQFIARGVDVAIFILDKVEKSAVEFTRQRERVVKTARTITGLIMSPWSDSRKDQSLEQQSMKNY